MARTLLNSNWRPRTPTWRWPQRDGQARWSWVGDRNRNRDGVALAARCSCSKLKKCKCCTLYQGRHNSRATTATAATVCQLYRLTRLLWKPGSLQSCSCVTNMMLSNLETKTKAQTQTKSTGLRFKSKKNTKTIETER